MLESKKQKNGEFESNLDGAESVEMHYLQKNWGFNSRK